MSDIYEFSADADEDAEANEDTDILPNNINIYISFAVVNCLTIRTFTARIVSIRLVQIVGRFNRNVN